MTRVMRGRQVKHSGGEGDVRGTLEVPEGGGGVSSGLGRRGGEKKRGEGSFLRKKVSKESFPGNCHCIALGQERVKLSILPRTVHGEKEGKKGHHPGR